MMQQGTIFVFFALLLFGGLVVGVLMATQRGIMKPKIRRIAALDSIEEAVGRATEMGRPVHYTCGYGAITTSTAPQTFASFSVLTHVVELTAKYNTQLIVTVMSAESFPLQQELVRQAYLASGKPDMFHEDTVRYISSAQFAYAAGVLGIFMREKVAANIMLGYFMAESLLFAEGGAQAGAIQVAGTGNLAQTAFFVAACDYCLIGEELYAGGAYLSQDPIQVGSLGGQDYVKLITMCFITLGTLLATFNSSWLVDLMKK
jgi:hypothetical protein